MPIDQAFGVAGTVYRKDRSDDAETWTGKGKKKGASGPPSKEPSRSSTPVHAHPPRVSSSSTLTSDLLIKPKPTPTPTHKPSNQNASKPAPRQPAASRAVGRLMALIESLRDTSNPPAPKPCFCLARMHPLSRYTPLCIHCGFILCKLHPPASCCPSCGEPLLTASQRQGILVKLDAEMSAVLDQEEQARRRAEEEEHARLIAASGGGAFPTLGGHTQNKPQPPPPPQDRKVLTLNGKKPPILTTTRIVKVAPVVPSPQPEPAEPEEERVPRPPKAIKTLSPSAMKELDARPFVDVRVDVKERPVYVPEPVKKKEGGEEKKRRRRRGGGGEGNGSQSKAESSTATVSAVPA